MSQHHFVDYLWEHNFDKTPVAFVPSSASAPQDPESQKPGIYALSETLLYYYSNVVLLSCSLIINVVLLSLDFTQHNS